jgi:hypothetical protein
LGYYAIIDDLNSDRLHQIDSMFKARSPPEYLNYKFAISPNPFSQKERRGNGFKVPLPFWERDLG